MTQAVSHLADAYVAAVNNHDAAAYAKLFAQDAVVDDGGRTFHGSESISNWSRSDIFEANVTFELIDSAEYDGQIVLTTKVDGDFDRTGLPDPVVIRHYIRSNGEVISSLVCRLVRLEP